MAFKCFRQNFGLDERQQIFYSFLRSQYDQLNNPIISQKFNLTKVTVLFYTNTGIYRLSYQLRVSENALCVLRNDRR